MRLGSPDKAIREHVSQYWGFDQVGVEPARRMKIPSSGVGLVIGFGDPVRVVFPSVRDAPGVRVGAFVAGLHDTYAVTESAGAQRGVQIEMTPLAGHMLLGVPMHLLTNGVVDLEDVLGWRAADLVDQLHDAVGWNERFEILDDFLARRFAVAKRPSPVIEYAWRRLNETQGRIAVRQLASEVEVTRQHLFSLFRDQIGLSPKTMARVLRFQRAVAGMDHAAPGRLAEVAHACGYYDQAHLNREFRSMTGATPTQFLARRLPNGTGITHP